MQKFGENSNLPGIAVEGYDLGANWKYIQNFLLVINSDLGHISCVFWDIDAQS